MLMIIMHHCVTHGGGCAMEICTNKWIAYAIYPGGKICFDTFIAISAWFLVDGRFKAERFVKGWLEVLFYSVLTTAAAFFLGSQLSGVELFSAFLPMTGGVQGYAQTYLAFYLLVPLLSKVSTNMTSNENKYVIFVLSIFVFLSRYIGSIVWSEQSVYSRLGLFIFIYFVMLYLKRNPVKILYNPAAMILIFIICWAAISGISIGTVLHPEWDMWKYITPLIMDEGGLLNLIGGLTFFFFFNSIKMPSVRFINYIGGTTFAVILIHDGHFFRAWTWHFAKSAEWLYSNKYILLVPLCAMCIYAVCAGIDLLRKAVLEKPLFNSKWMQVLCQSIDKIAVSVPVNDVQYCDTSGITDEKKANEISDNHTDDSYGRDLEILSNELRRNDRALAEIVTRYVLNEDKSKNN